MSFGGGAGITAEQKFKTMKVERITTDEGEARAIIFGKVRGIVGQLIWAGKIRKEWQYAGDVEVGKDSEETYKQVPFRHYAIGICEAEGNVELSKIWRNNKLVYDASRIGWAQNTRFMKKTAFYNGAYTQLPNATMESALGAGNVPAFRGTAYMMRRNINLEAFQGAVPQYVFEVDATYIPPAPSGSADLKMTVEAVPDEAMVGDTITVTYTVENLGVDDSESAVVNFTSNPALSIVSSALSKGSLSGGVWTIGDISNGDSETAEIVYEAIDDGIVTVGATVSAATPDPNTLNNYDFETIDIASAPHGEMVFTASGTFTKPDGVASYDVLIVAGGGGGGGNSGSGGGGAGGVRLVTGLTDASAAVAVGTGGSGSVGSTRGANGGNSSFGSYVAIGGGAAGVGSSPAWNGAAGGSGGGGSNGGTYSAGGTGGAGTAGQGNAGGSVIQGPIGGGGGGAGGAGEDANNNISNDGGDGGNGVYFEALAAYGDGGWFGGGGGGGTAASGAIGAGGNGGGGDGGRTNTIAPTAGQDGTGGGGGGGGSSNGARGGDGVVIVVWPSGRLS